MRDYVLDLQARSSKLGDALDHRLLGFLAFAEGRLLSLHPFRDFNGRTTVYCWLSCCDASVPTAITSFQRSIAASRSAATSVRFASTASRWTERRST